MIPVEVSVHCTIWSITDQCLISQITPPPPPYSHPFTLQVQPRRPTIYSMAQPWFSLFVFNLWPLGTSCFAMRSTFRSKPLSLAHYRIHTHTHTPCHPHRPNASLKTDFQQIYQHVFHPSFLSQTKHKVWEKTSCEHLGPSSLLVSHSAILQSCTGVFTSEMFI